MESVTDEQGLKNLTENKFIGHVPQLTKSTIRFNGQNNVLVCEEDVKIVNSYISFNGNNSLLYLLGSVNPLLLNIHLHNNSCFYIGKSNYFNSTLNAICSEQKHIFIGSGCLISFGIWIRTADPHLIYSVDTRKRINLSKSVYIGDSVWIGQNALILKGTEIHSGSIVGGNSVLSNKKVLSNNTVAGNPSKVIAQNTFWNGDCVHGYTDEQTEKSMVSNDTDKIFTYTESDYIPFSEIDHIFSEKESALEKSEKIKELFSKRGYNRFALKK